MLSLAQEHFSRTSELIEKIDKDQVAHWLLCEGYYPEQYVVPPCFHVENFVLNGEPYYPVNDIGNGRKSYRPTRSELLNVFFPKSHLTDRVFGIIEPKVYHDIVWHLLDNWDFVQAHLFKKDVRFYSYSFPIPVSERTEGELGTLRSGRMIYEFIEMAENNLVADASRYEYFLETDITNFYPSVYTHSLAWALHEKQPARDDKIYGLFGSKLDKLFQNANDGCTNGLAIGPVVSDLAAEIILAAIDSNCSKELEGMDFLAVRFKDDYKILCRSKTDADNIVKTLQRQMRFYNLGLNEGKTVILELPEGLFRPWILAYQPFSLKQEDVITYKKFETTLLNVLGIDKKYPNTGIIDKFLGELTTKDYKLKLKLERKQIQKTVSLLLLLKKRRAKVFPQVLAILELIIENFKSSTELVDAIVGDIRKSFIDKVDYLYDGLWIFYFIKSQGYTLQKTSSLENNPLFKSIRDNQQMMFDLDPNINMFKPIGERGSNKLLAQHLAIFPKEEAE